MTEPEPTSARPGISRLLREHRRAWVVAGVAAVFALLAGGALAAGAATATAPGTVAAASTTGTPTATARPVADNPTVSRLRTCSVSAQAADGRLAQMQAQVRNATTGEVLFDRGGSTPSRAASVMKVLTSAAALDVLGPDYRATTTVVKGSSPGSVVLVGGGDLTLSRLPSGQDSTYDGVAHLDDLARQVKAAWSADPSNPPLTTLVLDSSFFSGPEWQPSWNTKEQGDG